MEREREASRKQVEAAQARAARADDLAEQLSAAQVRTVLAVGCG